MPIHTEQWVIARWLYTAVNVSAVTTFATGGIFRGAARQDTTGIYGTIIPVPGGEDLMIVNGIRVWFRGHWDVVFVGTELQAETVDKAAKAADLLIHRGSGTNTDGRVVTCMRTKPIFFEEPDEGIRYVYSGGSYQIAARAE